MKAAMFNCSPERLEQKQKGQGGEFILIEYRDDWPDPKILHPNQVVVKTRLGGICASDLHSIDAAWSLYTTMLALPMNPSPLGHEVVGTVEDVGPAVSSLRPGDRVVLNPLARCSFYGFKPCNCCENGNYEECFCMVGVGDGTDKEQAYGGRGGFGGFGGGGFSEKLIGFEQQFHLVPDNVADNVAVLSEPFTIGLHAVARNMPKDSDTVVVVGAGIIGLMTIKALRALGSKCRIITLARYPSQAEKASQLGSNDVIVERDSEKLYDKVADLTGGPLFSPIMSKRVLYGNKGPDVIYDTVGSEDSLDDCLRLVRSNGRVVIVGLAFEVTKKVDWSLVVWKEITVSGAVFSGKIPLAGRTPEPFAFALEVMAQDPSAFAGLVTHAFPIEQYQDAVRCVHSKGKTNAIKVVLDYC